MKEVCSYADEATHSISCTLEIVRCGRLDALALWFDLHLCGDVTISTSPERRQQPVTTSPQGCGRSGADIDQASCWEQAIYPVMHVRQGNIDDDVCVY